MNELLCARAEGWCAPVYGDFGFRPSSSEPLFIDLTFAVAEGALSGSSFWRLLGFELLSAVKMHDLFSRRQRAQGGPSGLSLP